MENMYSVGELIDKLIIENIKIFNLRDDLHTKKMDNHEFVEIDNKMMTINSNRSIIVKFLNSKIDDVVKGKPNSYFKDIKTYGQEKKKSE